MEQLKTSSGIFYYKIGTGPDSLTYMHGYNENPLYSQFYKTFFPYVKDKVTLYMPVVSGSGWEKPWNGVTIGEDFLRFMVNDSLDKRHFVTTFSAGADPDYLYKVDGITAFASVAGKADNYNGFMEWVPKAPPVYAFAGTSDTSQNSYALCEKTWCKWFIDGGGSEKLKWRSIQGANHGGVASYAYNPANGLWEWFDSIGKPVEPPDNSGIDKPGLKFYLRKDGKIIFEFEGAILKELTPD